MQRLTAVMLGVKRPRAWLITWIQNRTQQKTVNVSWITTRN